MWSGRIAVRALLEAVEQMSPYMLSMGFDVRVEMPYNRWTLDRTEDDGATVEVNLSFRVPLDVAEKHGFTERPALPAPTRVLEG